VPPIFGVAGGVEMKVMAWGGSVGAGGAEDTAVAGTSAMIPVTAVDVDGCVDHVAFEVGPDDVATSAAMAVCEDRKFANLKSIVALLGAEGLADALVLPSSSTRRSLLAVVVTLGGARPLPAPATSMGCVGLSPPKAMVTMVTCVAELRVAFAMGVELATACTQEASWVLEPFTDWYARDQPVGQATVE